MLTRRAKAYSSSCSQTVSLSPAILSQFILGVSAAAEDRKGQLESSHSPQVPLPKQCYSPGGVTTLCQRFPYAPFNAMVTKISKWSRIQDSCWITPKTESLVVCAMPDIPSKFQKDPSITFWVILLIHRKTNKQTNRQTNKNRQKHYLLGGGNKNPLFWKLRFFQSYWCWYDWKARH